MPVGEIVLLAVAGWAILCVVFNHAWPGPFLENRFFWSLLIAQAIALGAYVVSDLYRRSLPHDIERGWSRMILLAVDVVAVAYLFGRDRRIFLVFLLGQNLGDLSHALIYGPLFGDMWKFGVSSPLVFFSLMVTPVAGSFLTMVVACGLGVLNFVMDYRSLGGMCLLIGCLTFFQVIPRALRWWLAPFGAMIALVGIFWIYQDTQNNVTRATRSDVERSAMVKASFDAIRESPFLGHGSWFSNTNVYEDFMIIRQQEARQAHVGGFAPPGEEDPDLMAFHSQILVALVEGGVFGATFFFVYGGGLFWELYNIIFVERWRYLTPIYTLVLLTALWNYFCSPFSGAHRVYIAMACGLMFLLQADRSAENSDEYSVQ